MTRMRDAPLAPLAPLGPLVSQCPRPILLALLLGCGNVTAMTPDAPPAPPVDASPDAAVNRCAPNACLLSDEFDGTSLDPQRWGMDTAGGATVTVQNGSLTLHLPAVADAYAEVYSLVGFPVGTTFHARVMFTAGQFYDHKGAGFASSRITADCFQGEAEAAMFRGQDGDSYIETKLAGTPTCNLMAKDYNGGTSTLQIAREADGVRFTQDDVALAPIKTQVPTGLLPIRFSAYTFTRAPTRPVQIDVEWVAVMRQ